MRFLTSKATISTLSGVFLDVDIVTGSQGGWIAIVLVGDGVAPRPKCTVLFCKGNIIQDCPIAEAPSLSNRQPLLPLPLTCSSDISSRPEN